MSLISICGTVDDIAGAGTRDTTSGNFDANYTDECISVINNAAAVWDWSHKTTTGTVSIHWHMKTASAWESTGSDGYWFDVDDGSGVLLVRMETSNGNNEMQVFGSGSATTGYSLSLTNSTEYDFDLVIEVVSGVRTASFYVDGVLALTANVAEGSRGDPANITFHQSDIGGTCYYSEGFVRDEGDNTIGVRMAKLNGNAVGNYTDGTGDYTDLDELDTNGVELAATEKYSWNVASLAVTPSAIQGVAVNILASTAGPTQLQPFTRISATDYTLTAETIPNPQKPITVEWTVDPATTVAWTEAGVNAFEFGIEAQA